MSCWAKLPLLLLGFVVCITTANSLSSLSTPSRRALFHSGASTAFAALWTVSDPKPARASVVVSDAEVAAIVQSDLVDRQFLVTGNLTRSIYSPTATFTDETNTFGIDQWITGTAKLFVGNKSNVRLIGPIEVSPKTVEFRFDEDLMFNIPFNPVVFLSGRVVLTRDEGSGLITAYREFWDQDIATVLKSAKF